MAPEEIRIDVALGRLLARDFKSPLHNSATWTLTLPARLRRRTCEVRLVVPPPRSKKRRDAGLIKLIVRAHEARQAFETANGRSLAEVAQTCGYDAGYFAVLVKLGYLAPPITAAILDGRQPDALPRQQLARIRRLPCGWDEQRRLLQLEGAADSHVGPAARCNRCDICVDMSG